MNGQNLPLLALANTFHNLFHATFYLSLFRCYIRKIHHISGSLMVKSSGPTLLDRFVKLLQ